MNRIIKTVVCSVICMLFGVFLVFLSGCQNEDIVSNKPDPNMTVHEEKTTNVATGSDAENA